MHIEYHIMTKLAQRYRHWLVYKAVSPYTSNSQAFIFELEKWENLVMSNSILTGVQICKVSCNCQSTEL